MLSCNQLKATTFSITLIAVSLLLAISNAKQCLATVFLDGSTTNCSNGSTTYNPSTRSCGSGSDTVYLDLASFSSNIVPGKTNYIRAGSYFRDNPGPSGGALRVDVTKAGTSAALTVVRAYPGEELKAIVGTATRGATYNSNPGDTTGAGSWNYYPGSAIMVNASYVTIFGLKTYGQLYAITAHDVTIDSCDLGGGGPSEQQGNVVKFKDGYNYTLRNSLIHNSCRAIENDENGSAVIGYWCSFLLENNTFYDNWGVHVFNKDGLNQAGRTTEIRNNFFGLSSIYPTISGLRGYNQYPQTAKVLVHHNIFYHNNVGYSTLAAPTNSHVIYNNTFVDCNTDISNGSSGGPFPIQIYNNIFYHSAASKIFISLYALDYLTGSDWNLYYSSGTWNKSAPGGLVWQTTLPGWKTFSLMDSSSISSNPNFVNQSGSTPADFKRSSYIENLTGSPYSSHAGAYDSGSEIIGYTPVGNFSLLSAPSGITITKIVK